jgi:hypothetical protein
MLTRIVDHSLVDVTDDLIRAELNQDLKRIDRL